ncbi:MAG TPA: hypothetical protein VGK17_15585 [Propionicimonas sp.]
MADDSPKPADAPDDPAMPETTWAGNQPLSGRWWWSPALMLVVGVVVTGYQTGPIRSGNGIVLNWVMAVIGVAVAVAGLVSLRRAHAEHRAAEAAEASAEADADGA